MGFFSRGAAQARVSLTNIENPNVPLGLSIFHGGNQSTGSGVHVTENSARTLSAMSRAVDVRAGAIAASPVSVRNKEGKEVKSIFDGNPHPLFTWVEWLSMAETHIIYHGDHFSLMDGGTRKDGDGPPKKLFPLDPRKVTPVWVSTGNNLEAMERQYRVELKDGTHVLLTDANIFHIPGADFDGLSGKSVIQKGAESLGLAIASEQYASSFYGRGTMLSGILTTEKKLKDEEAKALKHRWQQLIAGRENMNEIAVMDSGASFEALSATPAEAQFLEARQHNVREVSRWTGVQPALLMEGEAPDLESVGMIFKTFTLRAEIARFEARLSFIVPSRASVKFNTSELERADMKTRWGAYLLARKANVLSVNTILEREGEPRIDDPRADDPFFPVSGGGPESGGEDMGGNTEDEGNGDDGESIAESG